MSCVPFSKVVNIESVGPPSATDKYIYTFDDLAMLVDYWEIDVICYGLKLNWQGEFFEGSHELMKIADRLEQAETFCKQNQGAPALFHVKLGGSDEAVETGYEDLYDTVSRKVWKQWFDDRKNKE